MNAPEFDSQEHFERPLNPEKHFRTQEELEEINRALAHYGLYDARIDFYNFHNIHEHHQDSQWQPNPDLELGKD